MSNSFQPHGLQHTRPALCSPLSPGVCSNSHPLSQWCYLTISSLAAPFSYCLQSFPASESFPINWLFASGSQSIGASASVAKVLELQHQSFQWIFRVDFLQDWLVWYPYSPRDSQESSPAPQFKSINSLAFSLLYGPALTPVNDYLENHSFDYMDLCQQNAVSAF